MSTTAIQATRRWRPPSFLEMMTRRSTPPLTFEEQALWKEIDLAMRTAFDGIYLLENVVGVNINDLEAGTDSLDTRMDTAETDIDAIQADYIGKRPAVAGKRVAWGTSTVTGSLTGIVTGLAVIEVAVVCIQSSAAINEWVTYALNATPGQLDLYCWKPTTDNGVGTANVTPIASTTARTVAWLCGGT